MINFIKSLFSNSKKSLFTFNNEPFSKFSILLIILLDIFLLVTIFTGINSEKNMAPDIHQKYPSTCQNHFNPTYKRKVWDNTTNRYLHREDKFPFTDYNSFNSLNNYGYYSSKHISIRDDNRVSQLCKDLDSKISVFVNSREFKNNKALLSKLKNNKRNTFSDINNIEQRYNTTLFEKTAREQNGNLLKTKKKYYSLLNKEKYIDKQIKSIKKVSGYKGYEEYVKFIKANQKIFKEELKSYKFWQPFISFLYLLKFTLPLLFLSLLTYRISNRINIDKTVPMKLLKLVSSHIVFLSIIPIFFNTLYLIYHIIPHRFLEGLIKVLYEFGFIFLGYYFLMFIGIAFFGILIFFIQRSIARRETLRKEIKEKTLYIDSYNNNRCPNCKNSVDYNRNYCGYCKEELNRKCNSCGSKTPKHIEYCLDCGKN